MAIADLFLSSEQGGWYDPSDLTTLWQDTAGTIQVTADGDAVARIDDKSGNINHLTESTAANRPLYKTDGTLHWLEFDGTNDRLLTAAAMDMSTTDQVTHAMAVETGVSGTNIYGQLGGANSAGEFGLTTNASSQLSGTVRGSAATAALWVLSDIALTQKNVFVQLGDISTDTNKLRCDGAQVIENTGNLGTGNMASGSTYIFGNSGGNYFTGKLYQLVIRGNLTEDAALATLEDDLRTTAGHSFSYTSGEMFVEMFNGAMNVLTPLSTAQSEQYMLWRCEDWDTTGGAYGGGEGSVWEDCYLVERSGDTFGRIHRLTDTGLNEFALKKDDTVDDFIGHDVHSGMARRAPPVFKIDGVAQSNGTRANFSPSSKVEFIEYYELYDAEDGTTVIANLDTTKTWEDGRLKLNNELTFLVNADIFVAYMCMFSPYREFDNDDAESVICDRIFLPDQDYAEYAPTTGVDTTYPNEHHFKTVTNDSSRLAFDIEVQGTPRTEFRSWVQSGGGSRKFYMSPLGVHDTFGLVSERTAESVVINDSFALETWITPSIGANVNTLELWKGAVQPAESGASGNEIKLWKGAVEPAYVAPAASSGGDRLISGITSSVTRNITRGVTESWSN